MRSSFLRTLFVLLLFPVFSIQAAWLDSLYHYLENPALFELNQVPGRAYHIPENNLSLNGEWRFRYFETPDLVPRDIMQMNSRKWAKIRVPSNWEMEGWGDKKFRNMAVPFSPDPPKVPHEYNPTGCYDRNFRIPDSWAGQDVFLRFEKVASASFVWVNGQQVGFNQGAHEPIEYRITPYLKKGNNHVTVMATKYSAGYYLEDQDYWRLSGIFDDVTLFAAPLTRIFDWSIQTPLVNEYKDALLQIAVELESRCIRDGLFRVEGLILNAAGEHVMTLNSLDFSFSEQQKPIVRLNAFLKEPLLWSAESPNLYHLQLKLFSSDGQLVDQVDTPMGFCMTEIKGECMLFNGKPVKLSAMNSHMQHPTLGHAMDEQTIRRDFEILKQFNFNSVRTSHYPPTNLYLKLANEYGLYIIDEAGTEAHATEWLSSDKRYTAMYRDRVRKMVLRDRNNPCIIFWSAGNESGEGENIAHAIQEGKSLDSIRPWMYGGNAFSHSAEDIIGPRYPFPLEHEVQVGIASGDQNRRPSFLDEYLSVAGNGGGGMDEYWENFYRYPRLMGGAIWDFVSVGLDEPVRLLQDASPHRIPVHIMGNARLEKEKSHPGSLFLNGHDQWVEVYESPLLEITGEELTLDLRVKPVKQINASNTFITKGSNQFGLEQVTDESLRFYIYTDRRHELSVTLPNGWYGQWHHITAIYDHGSMSLWIDGIACGSRQVQGPIRNLPYPVNIGRDAQRHGQEITGYLCAAFIDRVVIAPKVLSHESLSLPNEVLKGQSSLWLDFNTEVNEGRFYSYGIGARTYGSIWPDRKIQPEMWQFKYSTRPIVYRLINPYTSEFVLENRNQFLSPDQYRHRWYLQEDGIVIQEGELGTLSTMAPFKIPLVKPDIKPGKTYHVLLSATLKADEIWASAGHEVAWDQYLLPWTLPAKESIPELSTLTVQEDSLDYRIIGDRFEYCFDKQSGLLAGIRYDQTQLLKEPIKMNVWRAPLANEVDDWNASSAKSVNWRDGMGWRIAAEFYSLGIDRLTHIPVSLEVNETDHFVEVVSRDIWLSGNNDIIEKKDLYIEGKPSNGFINTYRWRIYGNGELELIHKFSTSGKMPLYLPRIGISMAFDRSFDCVEWYGRGPQENYPDRKTGYKIGNYKTRVADMFEPYLLPQDCGLRTDNRFVRLTQESGLGIQFRMDQPFNFNTYHHTTDNLWRAKYTYQLSPYDGTTFNLDYKTSGVGCTCRAIFNDYKVTCEGLERTVSISPVYIK